MRLLATVVCATAVLAATLIAAAPAGALTVAGGKVYWTEQGRFSDRTARTAGIGRANLDGTGVRRFLVRGVEADQLAVSGRHLYWTEPSSEVRRTPARIGRANLNGARVRKNFLRDRADSVAVQGRFLYWSRPSGIARSLLNGKGVRRGFIRLAQRHWGAGGVKVNGSGIFWGEGLASSAAWDKARESGPTGRIGRADLRGKNVNRRYVEVRTSALMTSSVDAFGLDGPAVYWLTPHPDNEVMYAYSGAPNRIGFCEPVLGNCGTLLRLIDEKINVNSSFTVADGYLYWAQPGPRGTRIFRVELQGEMIPGNPPAVHEYPGKRELVLSLPYSVR